MDELTKYRITGAVIWLALLILLVPSWYSDPVVYDQPHTFDQPVFEDTRSSSSTVQPLKNESPAVAIPPKTSNQNSAIKREEPKVVEPQAAAPTIIAPKTATPAPVEEKPKAVSPTVVQPSQTNESVSDPAKTTIDKIDDLRKPAWLVRVASFNSIEAANTLLSTLEVQYAVTIGDFSSSTRKVYSVRVGPYYSFDDAMQAKHALDAELSTDAVVVKIR